MKRAVVIRERMPHAGLRQSLVSVAEALLRHAEQRLDKMGRAGWLFWTEMRAVNLLADGATGLLPSASTREMKRSKSKESRDG
jgi:hypothetical protein